MISFTFFFVMHAAKNPTSPWTSQAHAYGHGIISTFRKVSALGIWWFAQWN